MARITVEDCLKKVDNRFLLVNMVAKRVRQIREGSEYLVNSPKNEDIVVSLREVAAEKIVLKTDDDSEEEVKAVEEESQDTEAKEIEKQESAEKKNEAKEKVEETEE